MGSRRVEEFGLAWLVAVMSIAGPQPMSSLWGRLSSLPAWVFWNGRLESLPHVGELCLPCRQPSAFFRSQTEPGNQENRCGYAFLLFSNKSNKAGNVVKVSGTAATMPITMDQPRNSSE